MSFSGHIIHARIFCALLFASGAVLRASTITTVSTSAIWTTHSADGIYQGFYTTCSNTDPAASSCVSSDPTVSFANGIANASATDGKIGVYALGAAGSSAAEGSAQASASFNKVFTFTPDRGQNNPTEIEFELQYSVTYEGDAAGGYATFNGFDLAPGRRAGGTDILLSYVGGPIVVTGEVSAGADGEEGYGGSSAGIADADLNLIAVTLLDANGAPVSGTFVDPPESILGPPVNLFPIDILAPQGTVAPQAFVDPQPVAAPQAILAPEPDLAPLLAMLIPALLWGAKNRRASS